MDASVNVGVAAVDRAMTIVKVVAQHKEPITLADLSRSTGFYKSTLLRLIASLEKVSLVVKHMDGGYLLGPLAYELGHAYQGSYLLQDTIRPILQELVDQGSESSSFHVYFNEDQRMCLLRVNSHHSTLDSINTGDKLPLKRGAAGNLIRLFHETNLLPTRKNIMVLSMGERDPNCAAVAYAVFGAGNKFVGALSLSGPKERFTKDSIEKLDNMAFTAARRITESLGGNWSIIQARN